MRTGDAIELVATPEPLAAGRYTQSAFTPRLTFEVAGPWHAVQLFSGFFDIQRDVGSPDVIAVQFTMPTAAYGAGGASVELVAAVDGVTALRANESLATVGSGAVRLGGRDGVQITVENATDDAVGVIVVPPGPLSILPGRRLRLALLDTSAGVLAVLVGGSAVRWEKALAVAKPVLDSIEIGD